MLYRMAMEDDTLTPTQRRASAGGLGRAAKLDPARRADIARAGWTAANSPAALARRLVRRWPETTRAERAEVRAILAPLMPSKGQ